MTIPLVIFGLGDAALLAHTYFTTDGSRDVAAFAVDRSYMPQQPLFCGVPVVAFEDVENVYPPAAYDFFVALGYSGINALRKEKYLAAKRKGYRMSSYVSSRATVLNGGAIGENCFILEDNTIQPFSRVGDNVVMWSGNHLGHHSIIGDHCFLASHIVVSGRVEVSESCFIGVNATIRDHIKIGVASVIGAGATILSDVEPHGVYAGVESERSRVPSNRLKKI